MLIHLEPEEKKELFADISRDIIKALGPALNNFGETAVDEVFSVEDLMAYLGVKRCWVHKRTSHKEIPYFKMGQYLRFRKSEIDKWFEECRIPVANRLSVGVGTIGRVK